MAIHLLRGPVAPGVRLKNLAGWCLIFFALFFKLTFLYVTDVGPAYPGQSFLFLRPSGFGYWAVDWRTAQDLLLPGFQLVGRALASGRGLCLPFALPLDAVSFLFSLAVPVTGFLLIHHFGRRVRWWHLALAAMVALSLGYQTTTVRVFTAPDSQIFRSWGASILEAAQRTGVSPELLAAVMLQESGGHPDAVSYDTLGDPVAYGLMQLIPETASRFGLPKERLLDPAANIMAGARYLAVLNHAFHGQTDLVLAGYYAGEQAVRTALGRAGLTSDRWNGSDWPKIRPYLPGVSPGQPSVEQYVQEVEAKIHTGGTYVAVPGPTYLAY